jgi:hypothetical protein
MLNFNNIRSDDGFFETTYGVIRGADLNNLPEDMILDIVDTAFPKCKFSIDLKYLVVQLTQEIKHDDLAETVNIDECLKAIEKMVYGFREKGFFVYDNDVSHINKDTILIDWSFQRKLPVETEDLLAEIQDVQKQVQNSAELIIRSYSKSKASLEKL